MKLLFVIGQCVRILHTDPWDFPTYRIEEIGKYSYRTTTILSVDEYRPLEGERVLHFNRQQEFEAVPCPKVKDAFERMGDALDTQRKRSEDRR